MENNLIDIKAGVLAKAYQTSVYFYEIIAAENQGSLTTVLAKNGHTVVRFCTEMCNIAYDTYFERYLTEEEIKELL